MRGPRPGQQYSRGNSLVGLGFVDAKVKVLAPWMQTQIGFPTWTNALNRSIATGRIQDLMEQLKQYIWKVWVIP